MRQNVFRSAWMVAAGAMFVTGVFCGQARAINDILNQWTFETSVPSGTGGTNGPYTPETLGSGTAGATGVHATGTTTWSNPAGNGSSHSFSATNWLAGDYWQFAMDTIGKSNIGLQFDQVSSTTGPRDFTLQYSTNGTTFTNFANYSVQPNANPAWGTFAVGPLGLDTYDFNLSSITALNNAASVTFRLLAASPLVAAQQGSTAAATGTDRVDNVSVLYNYDPTQAPVIQPVAPPVLPATNDIVVGLGSGRNKVTLELVRGSVAPNGGAKPAPYSAWTNQNFSRFVKFDNLGGTAHNVHGNLLALDTGANTAGGGNIYSYATQGTQPLPAPQKLANTGSTSGSAAATTIGGLSVSPGNTKIAMMGFDTGKVLVYDYTPGNGLGTGAALSGLRQSNPILGTGASFTAGGQQGTAWLNDSTVLAFNGLSGQLYEVNAGTMAESLKQTVVLPPTAQLSTALAYNPAVSPYLYAMYSGFSTGIATNRLYIFDPAGGAYTDLTAGGLALSMTGSNTARDIALDASGNLFIVTNASPGRIAYITAANLTALTPTTVDWYNDEVFQSQPGFAGLDIGFAAAGIAGDYNNDGKVNAQDYVIWRKTNINGPAGYTAWRANYGTGGPGAGAGLNGASVPEPASLVLLVIGLAAFCSRRRSA